MNIPYLSSFLGRRAKFGLGRRAAWAMWAVAVLCSLLAVGVPWQQPASAQSSPSITLTISDVNFETATATISATGVTYDDWIMRVEYETSSGEYYRSKSAGPGLTQQPQAPYTFEYDFDSDADTISATVTVDKMKPASDYVVKVILYQQGEFYNRVEDTANLTTNSGCSGSPNPGENKEGSTTRVTWFGIYYFTDVTETGLMLNVTVSEAHAPLNSGRCVYFTYRESGGTSSGILTAYVHRNLPGGSRGAMIGLPDLDPNTESLKPGTRYNFHLTVDEDASDGAVGLSGTTLGTNTGISEIEITELTDESAKATATIRNASEDDKFVYMRIRTSPEGAAEEDRGRWDEQDKMSTTTDEATFNLDRLDAGTRYEVEASVKEDYSPGMSLTEYFTTLPGAPTIDPLTEGDRQLEVTWAAPTEGAATITGYTVKWQDTDDYYDYEFTGTPPSHDVAVDLRTYTIENLENGNDYVVHVIAKNESGGTESNGEFGTPMGLPNAPNNLRVAPGNEKLALTWDEPTTEVGVTVNGYKVQWKEDSVADWDSQTGVTEVSVSGLTHEITGLTNGTTYDVRVRSDNGITSDNYNWAEDDGTPRPDPIVTKVTVADSTITQTEATATVAIDNQTDDGQTVHLRHRVNTPGSSWKDEPTKSAAPADTSVDFSLSSLAGNTEHVVEAWLAETPGTTVSTTFTTDPVPPGVPTNTTVKPGVETLKLEWDPPTENGGATINHYVIEWDEYDSQDWNSPLGDATTTGETYDIPNLTNRTRYAVRIRADNLAPKLPDKSYNWVFGDGTPRTIPAEPTVTATPDNARLHVSWNKPDNGGEEISGFVVQYKKNADSAWITHAANAGSNTLKTTIPDLDNGDLYDVRVRAFNSATVPNEDDYKWGKDGGTPRTIPAEPTLRVTAGNTVLEVSWDEPDDGGDDITGHVVQYKKNTDDTWDTSNATIDKSTDAQTEITSYKTTISNLDNGETYLVRVRAVNSVVLDDEKDYKWGTGSGKPKTIPAEPEVSVTPGNAQLEVNWNKPDDGGDTITGFFVQYMKDTDTGWTDHSTPGKDETSTTISSLDNGDMYTVRVRAVNSVVLDDEEDYNWGDDSNKPRTIPNAPDSLTVTHGSQQLTATWEKPTGTGSDGGAAITGYEVQWKEKSSTGWSSRSFEYVTGIDTLTLTFSQHSGQVLTNGVTYEVRVRAVNTVMLTDEEDYKWKKDEETPSTTPGAPLKVRMSNQGDKELKVEWDAPDVTGGDNISGYVVQWRVKGISDWASTSTTEDDTIAADKFSHTFDRHLSQDLVNGVKYEAHVIAMNRNGRGTPSAAVEGKPRTTPDFPTDLNVMEGIAELVLTWTAPDETGGINITIDYYIVEYMKEGESSFTSEQTADATEGWTLDELENGKLYTIQVKAHNSEGDTSEPSGQATGKPRTIPGKPAITGITVGNKTLTVAWTAPTDNGGADPTKYIIEWEEWTVSTSSWQASGSAEDEEGSPYEIGSLTNGTKYRVVVKAVNIAGTGPASDPEEDTPKTIPDAPTVELTPGDEELKVVWNKPDNGGDTITGFKVQYKKDTDEKWTELSEFGAAVLRTTITSLDNGDPYKVWVRAVNTAEPDAGPVYNWGKASDTPRTFPAAPSVSLKHGDEQLEVTWDKPDKRGATITGFVVQYKKAADTAWIGHSTPGPDDTTTTIISLDNGVPYDVRVRAVNSVTLDDEDNYSWGKKSETPRTIPGPVTELGVILGDEELTLSWVAPTTENNGGAPIKRFVLQWKSGNEEYDPDSSRQTTTTDVSKVLKGLSNGILYYIQVRADNDETAEKYNWVEEEGTPMSVPGAPTGLGVEEGDEQLVVSWVAPKETGGVDVEIENFVIQWQVKDGDWSSPDEHATTDGNKLTDTIEELENGTDYDIRVRADNDVEGQTFEWAYTTGKPRTIPSAPRSLNVTPGDGQLTLSWAAPSETGGLNINRYVVQWKWGSLQYNNSDRQDTTPNRSYTIRGLTNDDLHSVRVRADNTVILANEESYNWAPETGTPVATPSPPPPPPPPQNNNPPQRSPVNPTPPVIKSPEVSDVTFADILQTSADATVEIDNVGTSQKTVRLHYRIEGTTAWSTPPKIENTRGSSKTFALSDLTAGTTYEVQAWLDSSLPPAGTKIYEFDTLDELAPVPDAAISNLKCENIGQTSATAMVEIANAGTDMKQVFLKHSIQGEDEWTMLPFPTITYDDDTSIPLTGLTEGTTYEVAVALSNDFRGMVIEQCTTLLLDPVVSGISVDRRRQTSVWANVSIANANGEDQTVHLRYRTTTPQGEWGDIAKTTTSTDSASKEIAGLTADTEYEVQASLDGSFPDVLTKNATFTTLRFPSISNLEVEDETKNSATAVITIADPDGSSQTIHLRYRTTTPQGAWSSTLPASSTTSEASIGLTGLAPDTEYEVEVSLKSDFGVSETETFRTLPLDPVVSGINVDRRKQTSVWANVSIANANGEDQTVHLRYRTTTPRGDWSGIKTTTSDTDSASIDLSELTPGTEYDVQASLENSFPSSRTKHDTFTTLRWPSIASFEVENVGRNGATVNATISDSHGVPQTVHVRHRATGYIAWRPTQQVDSVDDVVSLRLRGLSSGTEYAAEASLDESFPSDETESVTFTTVKRKDDDDASSSGSGIVQAARAENIPLLGFSPQMLRFTAIEGGDNPAPQTFSVWNRAQGTMNFTLSNHEKWLSQDPLSGVSTGPADVVAISTSVDISGLPEGQYVDVINIQISPAVRSPGQVIVVLDVLPPDYIRQFVSRDEGGVITMPDGTVRLVVPPGSPPKDVDIELMKLNTEAHGEPPRTSERVVLALDSNTYPPGGDTPEDVAYSPAAELWLRLPEEDAAACDESRARVYSVKSGAWSLIEHRCETDESDKVWAVAEVERLGAFALVIDDAPVVATPTPVAAAVAPTPTAIPASAPAVIVQRISLPAQPPTPTPTQIPTPMPLPNGKRASVQTIGPAPTQTAVSAATESLAQTLQASSEDGDSGSFGSIVLAAISAPLIIGLFIVGYLTYRERRRTCNPNL